MIDSCGRLNKNKNTLDLFEKIVLRYKFSYSIDTNHQVLEHTGACFYGQNIVHYFLDSVQVFDLKGNWLLCPRLKDKQGNQIAPMQFMCVCEPRLYVSDSTNNEIYIFDRDYNYASSIHIKHCHPSVFSIQKSGNIMIYDKKTYGERNIVNIVNPRGDLIYAFSTAKNGVLDPISGIYTNSLDQILITHFMDSGIQVYDPNGNFLYLVDSKCYLSTSTVYVDENCSIFTVDNWNNKTTHSRLEWLRHSRVAYSKNIFCMWWPLYCG